LNRVRNGVLLVDPIGFKCFAFLRFEPCPGSDIQRGKRVARVHNPLPMGFLEVSLW